MNEKRRNELFEGKKHFVAMTVNKHYIILRSCHMESEDVKQELYLKLLTLIDRYNPKICPNLDAYLMLNLKYKLWNLATGSKRYGMPEAPKRNFRLLSLNAIERYYEPESYDDNGFYGGLWLEEAIEELPYKEKRVLNAFLGGKRTHCNNLALQSARRFLVANNARLSEMTV